MTWTGAVWSLGPLSDDDSLEVSLLIGIAEAGNDSLDRSDVSGILGRHVPPHPRAHRDGWGNAWLPHCPLEG